MATMQAKMGGPSKRAAMGRQRTRPEFPRRTPRQKFAHRLHDLANGKTFDQIAEVVGVPKQTVAKWFNGDNLPDLDYWPKLAKALGLSDWRELLPPL